MASGKAPIGIFDSGLGGLTVLQAVRNALPDQDFLYLGDNRHAPYGDREQDDIYALTIAGVVALFERGCRLVILACNTAAAVALRRLQETWLPKVAPDRRVLGVLVPMIEAVTGRSWAAEWPPVTLNDRKILFFATPATVASDAFPRELGFRARGVEVFQEACPGLVPAIERGASQEAARIVAAHCAAVLVRCPSPDAAILGCTHYPLVAAAFRSALPPETELLLQPEIVAESLADYLKRHPRFSGGTGDTCLMTTGDPDGVSVAASRFLGHSAAFESI